MFGSSNPSGQSSSSSAIGAQTQSVFGKTNNTSNNPFAPFGAQTGSSMFGGTSTSVFEAPQTSSPVGASSLAFGASSAPAFGIFSTEKPPVKDLVYIPPVSFFSLSINGFFTYVRKTSDYISFLLWGGGVVVGELFTDAQMALFTKKHYWWDIRVEGHDAGLPADDIKKALKGHFGSCGAIAAVEIHDSYALVTMVGDDTDDKALELNGSEMGGRKLVVDPKPYPIIEIPTTGLWFGSNPACT